MTYDRYTYRAITTLFILIKIVVLVTVIQIPLGRAEAARDYIGGTCSEVLTRLISTGKMDEAHKNEVLQSFMGKWVKWNGSVGGISETLWGMEVRIECAEDAHHAVGVIVSLDSSLKPQIQKLALGQQVKFSGEIEHFDEKEGITIKGEVISPLERVQKMDPVKPPVAPADPAKGPRDRDQAIESPSLSVGDEFVIEHKNLTNPKLSYVAERKVIFSDGKRVRITASNLNSKYVRTLDYDRQWNLIASRGQAGEGFDYNPPIPYYEFPLYPGKRWSGRSTERNIKTGLLREHSIFAEVGAWETITVPAGTFRTIKVMVKSEVKDLQTGQIKSGSDISWYAPAAKRSVKSELRAFGAAGGEDEVQIAQLLRYSVKAANVESRDGIMLGGHRDNFSVSVPTGRQPPPAPSGNPLPASVDSSKWFVVAGSFPEDRRSDAEDRLRRVRGAEQEARIVHSHDLPAFRNGLWAVVVGPFASKNTADDRRRTIESLVPDAYVKAGW